MRTHEWNRGQDAGRTFAEGAALLKAEHPDKAELIDAYCTRFDEMMPGPIAGSVEILAELNALGKSLYGLTNFSAETYPQTFAYPDLIWQDDVLKGPGPRAFRTLPVSVPVPSWCAHYLAMPKQPPAWSSRRRRAFRARERHHIDRSSHSRRPVDRPIPAISDLRFSCRAATPLTAFAPWSVQLR